MWQTEFRDFRVSGVNVKNTDNTEATFDGWILEMCFKMETVQGYS